MKRLTTLLLAILAAFTVWGQGDIAGQWNGMLEVQGHQLRIVFNITKTDTGYHATMDSPDQNVKGIPVSTTVFENSRLRLEVARAQIEYTGDLKDNAITGTFNQAGQSFPMNLSRQGIVKQALKRPQEPTKPYSYYTEDISFQNNQANITLAGTLSLPQKEGNYPAVILIMGSGPQNRDEELLGHKPFLVLADHLTKNGIAVLRYDDRGVGASKGNFAAATSADFATDVASAIAYLKTRKEINKSKIGLVGHSEGGLIAPMVASASKGVAFIVLLAGTGIKGDQLLLLQQELISKAFGMPAVEIQKNKAINAKVFAIIQQSKDSATLKANLTAYLKETVKSNPGNKPQGMTDEQFIMLQLNQVSTPWMTYFIKYDPTTALRKVKCAVLAINGEKDLQVPPKENLTAISNALKKGGNKQVTIKELPNLNHLFQEADTGLPGEYGTIEQTFSPTALDVITTWIQKQVK